MASSCSSQCFMFVAVPKKGAYIKFCNHEFQTEREYFDQLFCDTCDGYHEPSTTCREYNEICEHVNDVKWWKETYLNYAHWHDSTPCWTLCNSTHSHPGRDDEDEPCYDSNCKSCPVCAGRMDPRDWNGYACSRSCAGSYRR